VKGSLTFPGAYCPIPLHTCVMRACVCVCVGRGGGGLHVNEPHNLFFPVGHNLRTTFPRKKWDMERSECCGARTAISLCCNTVVPVLIYSKDVVQSRRT
jgi:hypothetical protein